MSSIRKGSTDIIVLPEMFTTGFTMNADKLAEGMNGQAVSWMIEMAERKNAVICGSVIIREKRKIYNRFIWAQPDGNLTYYNKRHLFAMAGEDKVYSQGKERVIVSCKGWNVLLQVCYDLRFPVWSRNDSSYDVCIYVANWPGARRYAWKQLLIARAIENQSYCVGLNRIGIDGIGISYKGDSMIVDPMGDLVQDKIWTGPKMNTEKLDYQKLTKIRSSLPFQQDSDKFSIKV
jgi:predicted amidohydrolase